MLANYNCGGSWTKGGAETGMHLAIFCQFWRRCCRISTEYLQWNIVTRHFWSFYMVTEVYIACLLTFICFGLYLVPVAKGFRPSTRQISSNAFFSKWTIHASSPLKCHNFHLNNRFQWNMDQIKDFFSSFHFCRNLKMSKKHFVYLSWERITYIYIYICMCGGVYV